MPDFLADLNDFAADLEGSGLLASPAFAAATVTGIIDIDAAGRVVAIKSLAPKQTLREELPRLPQRTSNAVAAFLSGQPQYWFGVHRQRQQDLHEHVLAGVDDAGARAVLDFLAAEHEINRPQAGNYVLRLGDEFLHHRPKLRAAWSAAYLRDPDPNPRVRVIPSEAFVRLGTRSNIESALSFGGNPVLPGFQDPERAGRALNWLLDRPSTRRHQDMAVVSWLAGDPFGDPTPLVYPLGTPPEGWQAPQPINTLHIAMLKAYPPARMHVRWYWSGAAAAALERVAAFDVRLRSSIPHYFRDKVPVRWPATFIGTDRYVAMAMETLQCIFGGTALSQGIMCELVRLHRKPAKLPNEPLAFAMLEAWAAGRNEVNIA